MDLESLRKAAAELGGTFVQGQTNYRWYGRLVGPNVKPPEGMRVEDLGKCSHAIKLPGVNYEIGVVRNADGSFRLLWDEYNSQPYSDEHDGHKLIEKFGSNLGRLCQSYTAQVLKAKAKARGWTCVQKTLPSGKLQLQMMKL